MKRFFYLLYMLLLALTLAACGSGTVSGGSQETTDEAVVSPMENNIQTAVTLSDDSFDLTVSDRDLDADFERDSATLIQFSDSKVEIDGAGASAEGTTVIISTEGVYLLSGVCSQGQVVVAAGDSDKVQLVLDDLELISENCPLLIASGDKVFLTLAEGSENRITDGASYALSQEDSTVDAAIFSKSDLTVNGYGSLTVTGRYKHGIVSKNDLVITGGQLTVIAASTAIEGKDCLKLIDGALILNAGSDGLRATNEEDSDRGFVYIAGGTLDITCGSDGIQAVTLLKIVGGKIQIASSDDAIHCDTALQIEDGEITVSESYEGLEAGQIIISGGYIQVKASDDGLNAAGGNDQSGLSGPMGMGRESFATDSSKVIRISGGMILVDTGGDGIDSNGNLEISGGVILVSGPTDNNNGALDYGGTAIISGGRFLALGSSGMAQSFSETSSQGSILVNLDNQAAGTPIALLDATDQVLISFTPAKAYQNAVISVPELQQGETYTLSSGTVDQADDWGYTDSGNLCNGSILATVTMDSFHYNEGGGMMQPGGGKGGQQGWSNDGTVPPKQNGQGGTRPQRPEDTLPMQPEASGESVVPSEEPGENT